jgi:hypothetical protein
MPIITGCVCRQSFKNEIKKIQLALPVPGNKASVKFFPEGGSLREGNRTVIGWEVKDATANLC